MIEVFRARHGSKSRAGFVEDTQSLDSAIRQSVETQIPVRGRSLPREGSSLGGAATTHLEQFGTPATLYHPPSFEELSYGGDIFRSP